MIDHSVPAVEVTRGDVVESIHHAAVAVVDRHGHLIAHLGDPGLVTYSRSSLKPFQAMPAVLRGFPSRFGLAERHLALVCASHSGEDLHVRAAQEILDAISAKETDLQCGVHVPLFYDKLEGAVPARGSFSQLHNNCSGKHSGMLALARILNVPLSQYLDPHSPGQQLIRAQIAGMLNLNAAELPVGIDGCSAPNYAAPLRALAHGYARLAAAAGPNPPADSECHDACAQIVGAMRAHPEMVSGEGRFDLALSRATNGRVFSKAGGEAIECAGIPERGWGIAVKVADGAPRASGPLVVAVLQQLGLLQPPEIAALGKYINPVLTNHRAIHIGALRVVAQITRDQA